MSLLSDFLGTKQFSLSDSPMFRELIKNIKNDDIYLGYEEFEYRLDKDVSDKVYRSNLPYFNVSPEKNINLHRKQLERDEKYYYLNTDVLCKSISHNEEVAA